MDNNFNDQGYNGTPPSGADPAQPLNPMAQSLNPMAQSLNPMAQQRPSMLYEPTGMPGVQPGVNPMFMQGGGRPPKKKKTGLIIGICSFLALAVAAVLLIFVFKVFDKGGSSGPEAVAQKFMEAMSDLDMDALMKTMPEEYNNLTDGVMSSLTSGLESMKSFGFEIKDIKTVKRKDLDAAEVKTLVKKEMNVDLDITEAASVTASAYMHVSFMGQEVDEPMAFNLTCGKIGKNWYVVYADEAESEIDIEFSTEQTFTFTSEPTETEYTTEEQTEETKTTEADSTEEKTTAKANTEEAFTPINTERKHGKPEDLPDDLGSMTVYIDGEIYSLITPNLPEGFEIKKSDVLDYDPEKEVVAGDYDFNSYPIVNAKYEGAGFYAYVMYCNPTGSTIKLKDAYVESISLSATYLEDKAKVPEVILPKGITWGTKAEEIKKAYGEPDYIYGEETAEGDEESNYISYTYYLNESEDNWYTDTVNFWISKENGLEEISISCNTWQK